MSAVWRYFKVENEKRIAVCSECSVEISRGGSSAKTFGTTSFINHLRAKHPEQHAQYERETSAAAKRKAPCPSTPTLSVANFFEKTKKFAKDSAKANGITKKMYDSVATRIHELLAKDKDVDLSFTTDIWSLDVSPTSMLSCNRFQIAVHEGVLSQRSIADIIATGRKIVGHFKHSPLAYSRLQSIQEQFGMPPKRFQQNQGVPNKVAGECMLESLFSQKRVLVAHVADYDLPATLTSYQWVLIENTLSSRPERSSSDASAADVTPLLAALKRLLSKEAEIDHGVKTTKSALLEAVNKRFSQADSEPLFCIATVLDPRYKDHYIDVEKKQRVREMVQAELDLLKPLGDSEVTHREGREGAETKRIHTTETSQTTQMPGRQRVSLLNSWTVTCQKSPSPGVTIL
ncbi:Zinc finger BED domain-containing protein 4 [Merluccius polli]|uniref:Zinc finger BED domain-containing protein 4 n=1 Tax=Merluccius polli TaxID=89951 RepID=A0AA47MH60_MERPO|nr:Zinc finger BED domain-containing protein 4 [Merluccius polli]